MASSCLSSDSNQYPIAGVHTCLVTDALVTMPRCRSSSKKGTGSMITSGGNTPLVMMRPEASHWAAMEGATPVGREPSGVKVPKR